MFFTKFPHRSNFAFAEGFQEDTGQFSAGNRRFESEIGSFEGGIHHIGVRHVDWGSNRAIIELNRPDPCKSAAVRLGPGFDIEVSDGHGQPVLRTTASSSFGVCGSAWLFQFSVQPGTRFYGMGEKNFGRLELSGIRTKFWNTDVWGDFHYEQWKEHPTDPSYLSVPYVILQRGETFVGILLDTPAPSFIETPGRDTSQVFAAWQETSPRLIVGAESGEPNIWILYGPSLKELTRKLQRLVGITPVPPIWALGYHQSRWGYSSHNDLVELDAQLVKHEIPCDGLWLDIDYMHGFRVFTVDKKLFPKGLKASASVIARNGRKVVAILDPGVKQEGGYAVYEDLRSRKLQCLNPEGGEYVGLVWPGETVFPDLTLQEGRAWWSGYVERMANDGLGGVWLDMNDPSTGPVDPNGMLFQRGRDAHSLHRNQYALGMQMGTYDGFLRARPNERPFVLSRSGSTGTSRYSAIWTGDNLSNYFYLRTSIPTTLNLSLSGICFNGPDVGGFGATASEQLMTDWVKACCLFPFMRNHSSKESADQEPWRFSSSGLKVIRKFIRLRYRLMPYLYNLFCDHEESGDTILRPLLYEFLSTKKAPLEEISDEFLVGTAILQAPILDAKKRSRKVLLPGKEPWLDACGGGWLHSGAVRATPSVDETPMFLRQGAIIPVRPGIPVNHLIDLSRIEMFVCACPGTSGSSSFTYRADDGKSFDYRNGLRSVMSVRVDWEGESLSIENKLVNSGYGPIEIKFLIPAGFKDVRVEGVRRPLKSEDLELSGSPFRVLRVA